MAYIDKNVEKTILNRCLSGDKAGWEIFVKTYSPVIYQAILKTVKTKNSFISDEDIKDIYSNIFLSLLERDYRKLKRFKSEKNYSFSSWIRIIAIRTSIDFIRKKYKDSKFESYFKMNITEGKEPFIIGQDEGLNKSINFQEIEEKFKKKLSHKDRLLLRLLIKMELSPKEIS
ncbi:MAG: sigma-70 family RNA polymerase sigma factor, partial [Thermodesulfobacteriota bacterium]|nr:sigma-70 family RNA polymerase sigma factor [Thermodesulfobacteriota bacterium]